MLRVSLWLATGTTFERRNSGQAQAPALLFATRREPTIVIDIRDLHTPTTCETFRAGVRPFDWPARVRDVF